jgi:hypothetical protein
MHQKHLMLENNGQIVFKKLEIKLHADHAGHFLQLKLYNGDSALPLLDKLILFFLLKILFHVIIITMDVMVDILIILGIIYQELVL